MFSVICNLENNSSKTGIIKYSERKLLLKFHSPVYKELIIVIGIIAMINFKTNLLYFTRKEKTKTIKNPKRKGKSNGLKNDVANTANTSKNIFTNNVLFIIIFSTNEGYMTFLNFFS